MRDAFAVGFLLALISLPLGLIWPRLFGGGRKRVLFLSLGAAVAFFVGFANTGPDTDRAAPAPLIVSSTPQPDAPQAAPAAAQRPAAPAPAATPPAPPPPPPPAMPKPQAAFLDAIARAADRYRSAPNDMVKGAERPARARELCKAVPEMRARGWVGTIETLSSNNEGRGVLAIRLDERTVVKTWNNSVSDAGSNTLIAPDSPLWPKVASLRVRQRVFFDGTFYRDTDDCMQEASLTVPGAMFNPEFIIRFSDVRPVP